MKLPRKLFPQILLFFAFAGLLWGGGHYLMLINYQGQIENKQFLVIGHRGAAGLAPENTLPAIEKAISLGTDMVEIDVHLSHDGKVCVMHDQSVDRTTDGQGLIRDLSWNQLQGLDAGSWHSPKYKGTAIPSLDQVMEKVDAKCKLLIEIKKGTPYYPNIEQKVVDAIRKRKAEKWCVIQSFNMDILKHIKQIAPEIRLQKLDLFVMPCLNIAFDTGFRLFNPDANSFIESYNVNYFFLRDNTIRYLHNKDKSVYVWTTNSESIISKMVNMGVDAVITNNPDKAIKLKEGFNK